MEGRVRAKTTKMLFLILATAAASVRATPEQTSYRLQAAARQLSAGMNGMSSSAGGSGSGSYSPSGSGGSMGSSFGGSGSGSYSPPGSGGSKAFQFMESHNGFMD